jgi:uncharacterized membrane protein
VQFQRFNSSLDFARFFNFLKRELLFKFYSLEFKSNFRIKWVSSNFRFNLFSKAHNLSINRLHISRHPIVICSLLHCLFLLTIRDRHPNSVHLIAFVLLGYNINVSSLRFTESIIQLESSFTALSIFDINLTLATRLRVSPFPLSLLYRLRPDRSSS